MRTRCVILSDIVSAERLGRSAADRELFPPQTTMLRLVVFVSLPSRLQLRPLIDGQHMALIA